MDLDAAHCLASPAGSWICSMCTIKHSQHEADYLACTVCRCERTPDTSSTSQPSNVVAAESIFTRQHQPIINSNSDKKRCSSPSFANPKKKTSKLPSSICDDTSEAKIEENLMKLSSKSTPEICTSTETPIARASKVQTNRHKQMSLTELFPSSDRASRSDAIANRHQLNTESAASDSISAVLVESIDLAKSSDDRKSWIEVWGSLPTVARLDNNQFKHLWNMHPAEKGKIKMMGKIIETPRWTQTYLKAYNYSGMIHTAKELPSCLQPLFDWARTKEPRLNGALVNWYQIDHKMGRHSDDERDLIPASDIFSFSYGGERVFRVSAKKNLPSGFTTLVKRRDFVTRNNSLIIMRGCMQSTHEHEVPIFKTKISSNRINVTFRCFK